MPREHKSTVTERMEEEYGSIESALTALASLGKSAIGRKYGCNRSYIRELSIKHNIDIPTAVRVYEKKPPKEKPESKKRIYVKDPEGLTRRAMTESMLRGEELTRARLMAQVTVYDRSHPMFQQVAAEIMERRNTAS